MRSLAALALVALLVAVAAPARAASDCPGVSPPRGYVAEHDPDGRAYDVMSFPAGPEPGAAMERIAGETCLQHYGVEDINLQHATMTQLAVGLAFGGAVILASDEHTMLARSGRGADTLWIRITMQPGSLDVVTIRRRPHARTLLPPSGNDDPRLGHMPDYVAETTDRRAFDQRSFPTRSGDETRDVMVQGARIEIDYTLRDGARPASDLDIQLNYRAALEAAGATILFTDERNTVARLPAAAGPVWIKVWSQETAINVSIIEQVPHRPSLLPPAGLDHRLLGHMPGYVAEPPERQALDEVIFTVQDGEDTTEVKVQGARYDITYNIRPGAAPASDLDIQLNYRAALAALGAQILLTDADTTVARLADGERVIWIKVWSQETAISLSFVKESAFKTSVRPTPADTLRTTLETRGRAALHIAFGFNQATLRPQAIPILAEVTRLLREAPGMSLAIEDHTDPIGPRAANLALALARAETVRAALIADGIDPARLKAVGIGPDRPVADNTTSEGRARNRRIVLVRQ